MVVSTDASAKDVAGLFIMGFVLAGGIVGLVTGAVSALSTRIRFWRGAALNLALSFLPWISLLLYWDFPFPNKALLGNLPFLALVLIGSLPLYLVTYGLARLYLRD
jgi:hypothetical protein